jgi:DNA-binding MarR family transcriptional regulator
MRRARWDDEAVLLQEAYSAAGLIGELVAQELTAAGVSPRLFSLLSWISVLQPVPPGDLAGHAGVPATSLRQAIRELEKRGDVRTRANPADGRSYLLEVTPKGRRLVDKGRPAIAAATARLEPFLADPEAYRRYAVELREALQRALLAPSRGRVRSGGPSGSADINA